MGFPESPLRVQCRAALGGTGVLLALAIGQLRVQSQIVTDGTVGQAATLSGSSLQIPHTLGTTVGNNLFHSFQTFNLSAGQTAAFTGPDPIANVLSRVTGGTQSTIDGTLECKMPNADFYLINPAGVVFGPNAKVNVPRAFAVTTADYIRLGEKGRFDARNPANDVLAVAPPNAFGFLSPQRGSSIASVTFNGSSLQTKDGKDFTVASGGVTIRADGSAQSSAILKAPGGSMQIAAVASAGELPFDGFSTEAFPVVGDIEITGESFITTSRDGGGGKFLIQGNNLTLREYAGIYSHSRLSGSGRPCEIALKGTLRLEGTSEIVAESTGSATGSDISVRASRLEINNGSIRAVAFDQAQAGNLKITVRDMVMDAQSQINGSTAGFGRGGNISIFADNDITMSGESSITSASESTGQGGNSGTIEVRTRNLSVYGGSKIYANTFGDGNAGDIHIEAANLHLEGELTPTVTSFISSDSQPGAAGKAGNIEIKASQIDLKNNAYISAETRGSGIGGDLQLTSDTLNMDTSTLLSTSTYHEGVAGNTTINAKNIAMDHLSAISASTTGGGDAGNISIVADHLSLANQSGIRAVPDQNSSGQGGNISISAKTVALSRR